MTATRSTIMAVSRTMPGILRPARTIIMAATAAIAIGIIAISGPIVVTAADDHTAAAIITTAISLVSVRPATLDAAR